MNASGKNVSDSVCGFRWTGSDPLSISTQASDIFLHMLALIFPREVPWIEFRFARFDRTSGENIGEDFFFPPRVELPWRTSVGYAGSC
ncbi:unnamed protein product [Penicillium camemberti]|uniref:Str. FM013 n=1 Tax=Penicillium camemberti (strain FM 013) TaxID=1429867 RepID=A0A0G4PYD6_PENC3|nr:unnamed protein product [Penicillium camemberti]